MELWGVEREGGSGSVENGGVGGDERSGRFVGGGARGGGGGRKSGGGEGRLVSTVCFDSHLLTVSNGKQAAMADIPANPPAMRLTAAGIASPISCSPVLYIAKQ